MIGLRTKVDQSVQKEAGSPASQESTMRPHTQPATARQGRVLLVFILVAFAAIATVYSVTVPLWEATDEPEHMQYIVYLIEQHRLPAQSLPTVQADGNDEGKQPPLYYLLALPFVQVIDVSDAVRIRPNLNAGNFTSSQEMYAAVHVLDEYWPWHGVFLAAHLVRLYSILLGTFNVLLVYGVATTCTGKRTAGVVAAGLVAFLPGYLFSTSTVDNDVLGYTLSSAMLLVAVRANRTNVGKLAWLFGALAACVLVSKLTAVPTMMLGALAVLVAAPVTRRVSVMLRLAAPSFIPAAYWVWRASIRDQRVIGRSVHFPASVFDSGLWSFHGLQVFFEKVLTTFFGEFSWGAMLMPQWLYVAYGIVFGTGLVLALWVLRQPRSARTPLTPLWLILAVPITQLASMLGAISLVGRADLGYDHARLFYPALAAVATIIAYGWTAHPRLVRYLRPVAPFALSTGLALPVLIAIFTVEPAYSGAWPVSDTPPATATTIHNGAFSGGFALVAAQIPTSPVSAGQPISIWLYWQVGQLVAENEILFIQLVNQHGEVVAAFSGLPSNTLPPEQWRPGDVVYQQETLQTSAAASPGDYAVQLNWRDADSGVSMALVRAGSTLTVGTIHVNAQG